MSNSPDALEFQHLQNVYVDTCEAFERGELTDSQARALIVSLRHTDRFGDVWKVVITRSGRRATFVRVGADETPGADPRREVSSDGLARMNRKYQDICAAFDRNELTREEARDRVLALRHTDSRGRTWMIDSKRSGRNAAFVEVPDVSAPQTSRPSVVERDTYAGDPRRRTATLEPDTFDDVDDADDYNDEYDDDYVSSIDDDSTYDDDVGDDFNADKDNNVDDVNDDDNDNNDYILLRQQQQRLPLLLLRRRQRRRREL